MGTLSNKYPNAQAVEEALDKGVDAYDNMGQIELVYNGTDIRFNNEVVNFQQIVDYITTDARFCYMVYNNRVLLTSDMQLTGGTRYVFFETSTTDSGLSKNTVVKVYSADGTAISSISHSTIANENFNNKVSTIAPNDKNSTVHYPNNKAVTEITDELKEDLGYLTNLNINFYNGYYSSTGSIITTGSNGERYTDMLNNVGGSFRVIINLSSSKQHWISVVLYDDSFAFISREVLYNENEKNANVLYTPPSNAKYLAFSFRTYDENSFGVYSYTNSYNTAANEDSRFETYKNVTYHDGYINSDGALATQTVELEKTTEYLKVNAGDSYTIMSAFKESEYPWCCVAYYTDVNATPKAALIKRDVYNTVEGSNINGLRYVIKEIQIPTGCRFIRFSTRTYGRETYFIDKSGYNLLKLTKGIILNSGTAINQKNTNILSINHRGYNTIAPENTLSAFVLSKEMGFDYVETDVSFTSDGIPVCLHDNTIDRTSNGTGNINSLTFSQVREYDFGSWKSPIYAGEKIPSLDEFINLCKRIGLHPYIELKASAAYTSEQIGECVDIVKKNGMLDKVTWISFNVTFLEYVLAHNPKARVGYVVNGVTEQIISSVNAIKTDINDVFVDANINDLTAEGVALCLSSNIPLEVWTVDLPVYLTRLDAYVSGVTSNILNASNYMMYSVIN